MYQMSFAYREAKNRGDRPIVQAVITSSSKRWVFGAEEPTSSEIGELESLLWDGTRSVGDGTFFNQVAVADWGPRVVSVGPVARRLNPGSMNLLTSLSLAQLSDIRVVYDNRDHYFSLLFSIQNGLTWLNQTFELRQGFPNLAYNEFLTVFSGKITVVELTDNTLTTIAEGI
jgi:hypothetical protein